MHSQCYLCGIDTSHHFCVVCISPQCRKILDSRPDKSVAICYQRSAHGHFCLSCMSKLEKIEVVQ